MNKAEFEGLKGAPLTILWLIEKYDQPFRKSDFWTYYTDKTVAKAFELLEGCELIIPQENEYYIVNPAYRSEVGVFPTPTTTVYINRLINRKDIKSSSRSEFFRPETHKLLEMVGEPKRTELASLKHATPEYVKAHIEKWRKDRKAAGMLIHRIEVNDPVPETTSYDPDRYTKGKYADLIQS